MKKQMYLGRIWTPAYDPTGNDNDAYVPEVWAEESLMILENNMVAANLVYRDFEDEKKDYENAVFVRRTYGIRLSFTQLIKELLQTIFSR